MSSIQNGWRAFSILADTIGAHWPRGSPFAISYVNPADDPSKK